MTNSPPDGNDKSFPYQDDDDFPNEFQLKLREFYDFFGLADKDLPIVIGFVVGSVVLTVIILCAILAWCFQRSLRQVEVQTIKSKDELPEKPSSLTKGCSWNSVEIDEHRSFIENPKTCIYKSISIQIPDYGDVSGCKLGQNELISSVKASEPDELPKIVCSISLAKENQSAKSENVEQDSSDSSNYFTNLCEIDSQLNEENESEGNISPEHLTSGARSEFYEDGSTKIKFSKKRRNRMRNDSAAAIALSRSKINRTQSFLHKDTDSLVENDYVVYDERSEL
ncbi:uncharacterized protein LOC141852911 [Brevipalpus obovatus]|uniref:uncharacterized protein LOC141852911 n=1 Tax=Brevipalpus obovatus TaxID=246614 RepID=UPI003D9EA406